MNPRISVSAIIVDEDNSKYILLTKRIGRLFNGKWCLPGGGVEPDETLQQAVIREVKEEVGLDVEVLCEVGTYHETGIDNGNVYDYLSTCFVVKKLSFIPRLQKSEVSKIQFCRPSEVPIDLAFKHNQAVRDYIRLKYWKQ